MPVRAARVGRVGVIGAPEPWSDRARSRMGRVMLVAAAASWVFQMHRFGFA